MSETPKPKTWHDVEIAAHYDPTLHMAVTLARTGQITREEALIAAALALVESNRKLLQEKTEALMHRSHIPARPCPECERRRRSPITVRG